MMDIVVTGLKRVFVFVDDVVLTSDTHEEHLGILKQLFERFRTHNLKCRLSKLQIARGKIDYLGYSISAQHGIQAGEAKTEIIKKWQPPKTVKEIKQFLGLRSFFRRTI